MSSVTQVLQDGLPLVPHLSPGVSHGLDVHTQTAVTLEKIMKKYFSKMNDLLHRHKKNRSTSPHHQELRFK